MASIVKTDNKTVVIDGCRIPFQRAGTGYMKLTAYDLGRLVIKGLVEKTGIDKNKVDRVIMGTVISDIRTSNVARESALAAGLPHRIPAHTVTMACVSSNQAITNAADLICSGHADIVIAGGTELMSDIPIRYKRKLRRKMIESQRYRGVLDYLQFLKGLRPSDFLPEVPSISEFSTSRTMGEDCDRLAARIGVSRAEQDDYALRSHQSAVGAMQEGLLQQELIPVRVPPGFISIERDNGPRDDTTLEKLSSLRPAFVRPYGTLTAGNSSFLTDGAAATLLMSDKAARSFGLKPKAEIVDYVYTAQDPLEELLLGPAYAIPRVLAQTRIPLKEIDVFEFHEAFAAQIIANLKCLDSTQFAKEKLGRSRKTGQIPIEKLNCLGGSLSIGHPFGATGARLVTTACNRLGNEDGQYALVASCAAGAIGHAMVLKRLN